MSPRFPSLTNRPLNDPRLAGFNQLAVSQLATQEQGEEQEVVDEDFIHFQDLERISSRRTSTQETSLPGATSPRREFIRQLREQLGVPFSPEQSKPE